MIFQKKRQSATHDVLGTFQVFKYIPTGKWFQCKRCHQGIQRKFCASDDISDMHIDGLQQGSEKEFLLGCIHYCPYCGYTEVETAAHFTSGFCNIVIEPNQNIEDVAVQLAKQYSREEFKDYIIGCIVKYCTNEDSTLYFQQFVKKCAQDYAQEIDYKGFAPYRLIVAVDVARMLGDIKTAKSLFRKIHRNQLMHPQLYVLYDAEKDILKTGSKNELYLSSSTFPSFW